MSGPSFLVLTEDGSGGARDLVSALFKRLAVHLDPDCQTQRLKFEPAPDLDDIVSANLWKGKRAERIRLHRRVAQKLLADDGFILHHVDADETWARRTHSVNTTRLRADILSHVRRQLFDHHREHAPATPIAELDRQIDARMTRYLCLLPHWEIESWLYQNTERAAPLCPGPPRCRREPTCRDKLGEWRRDREALDEVAHPSEELCLGKRHNSELVHAYPTGEVVAARKSLAAAVDAMLACDDLLHAIQRTHETPLTPPESL